MKFYASLPLLAAGLIALAAAAQSGEPRTVQEPGADFAPKFADPARLIDTFMADDRVTLNESLAVLEPARDSALAALDRAGLALQLAELDAARALSAAADAQSVTDKAQAFLGAKVKSLQASLDALTALREQPQTADVRAAIAQWEAENAVLETDLANAQAYLDQTGRDLLAAETAAALAQSATFNALASVDTAQGNVDAVQSDIETARQAFAGERRAVAALAAELSAAQISAFNRSLSGAVANALPVNLDAEQLAQVLDGNFGERQIGALAKAFEAEATFLKLARETDNDAFRAKAEREKARHLATIDRFSPTDADGGLLMPASHVDTD